VRRIHLAAIAATGLLTAGLVTIPASASTTAHKPPKTKSKVVAITTKLSCHLSLATDIPAGDVTVPQGAASGHQSGAASCGAPLLRGVETNSFTANTAGDLAGTYSQWFKAGTVSGTYALTPQSTGPPSPTSFAAISYTGKISVTGGSGLLRRAVGAGTLSCSSPDAAHFACTERLKLTTVPLTIVSKG